MSAISFDTLKFAERMERAGMPREQASALAEAQRESLAEVLDTTLATKSDIATVKLEISGLHTEMASVRGEMSTIKWMLGVLVAIAIANFAKQFF